MVVSEREPAAAQVEVSDHRLTIHLTDGRTISVPLEWYPRLTHASRAERENWEILGEGYALEWPDLDEFIGVEGLIAGHRSGESPQSFARWMHQREADQAEKRV
jgi:hypothetical protein